MMIRKERDTGRALLQRLHQEEILAEQVRQIYSLAPVAIIGTIMNSIIVFLVMKEVMQHQIILAWLCLVLLLAVARVFTFLYKRTAPLPDPRRAERVLLASIAVGGVSWGCISLFPFTFSIAHQVFLAFVVGGMAAGASSTYSKIRLGYSVFSITAVLPIAVRFLLINDDFHYAMGAMSLAYMGVLEYIARHNYTINRTSLLLRFENQEMIADLKQAQESMEKLNAQLTHEIRAKQEAEGELRAHHEHLEGVVAERTADLVTANEKLRKEIEERKQMEASLLESQERLVLAQRAGRVGVFDWNFEKETENVLWTAELEDLYGLKPGEFERSYQAWARRVHPHDLPELEERFNEAISTRQTQIDFEYRFLRADGQVRWMSAKAQLTYNEHGSPLRMIGTNRDITERKESQEKLVVAKNAAEAGNKAKSEFLANMSHEMRTPLAGVIGMIKLVLDMQIGYEERQLLEMARRSADSLLRLIADLLDFSRMEAGMMTFEQKCFSLREVMQAATEVIALSARERGVELSWRLCGEVPEEVEGDAGRVRQVLVNLLGNAVKFTEQGRIEVTAAQFDDPEKQQRRFILFSVSDSGVGIEPHQLETIFGMFTQIDSSLTRKHGGTGLGLALSRQIVEKMGGRIWAESTPGAGSTFHFTVPAHLSATEPGE